MRGNYLGEMLTSVLRTLIKNLVKESFYENEMLTSTLKVLVKNLIK